MPATVAATPAAAPSAAADTSPPDQRHHQQHHARTPRPRTLWLTRHGESLANQRGVIGLDAPLSSDGQTYARALPRALAERMQAVQAAGAGAPNSGAASAGGGSQTQPHLEVWTSTLVRTQQTAAHLGPHVTHVAKAELDEINAGICDGLSYEQIAQRYPDIYAARKKDKLGYRYPGGESYKDVLARLAPVVCELAARDAPLLIISHQAVLRALFGTLTAQPPEDVPRLSIPLHTLLELTFHGDGGLDVTYLPLDVSLAPAPGFDDGVTAAAAAAAAAKKRATAGAAGAGGRCAPPRMCTAFAAPAQAGLDGHAAARGGGGSDARGSSAPTAGRKVAASLSSEAAHDPVPASPASTPATAVRAADVDDVVGGLTDQLQRSPLLRQVSMQRVCSCSSSSSALAQRGMERVSLSGGVMAAAVQAATAAAAAAAAKAPPGGGIARAERVAGGSGSG